MGSKKHKKESKKKKHRSRSRSPLDGEERERKRHKKHKDRKKDRSPDVEEVPVDSHLQDTGARPGSRSSSVGDRERDKERERDERERERDRRNRETHKAQRDDKDKDRSLELHREPSPAGAGGAGAGDNLSIEETNRLRAKLGLKPLEVAEKPADDGKIKDDLGEFYHKPATNITQQKKTEKLREKLEERKEKRKFEQKLKTTLLAEESDEEDALAWVKKSRELEKQKQDAAKRAAMLDELDAEFGVAALVAEEQQQARARAYAPHHLRGLRVAHDIDALDEEREVVLTLADQPVLAAAPEDVLVNVNLQDDDKYKKGGSRSSSPPEQTTPHVTSLLVTTAVATQPKRQVNIEDRKKARVGYQAYDDEDMEAASLGFRKPVLAKYDEEINKDKPNSSKGFFIGDEAALEAKRFREMMRREQLLGGEGAPRRLESLQLPALQLAADYMDHREIEAKFKKTKRKGKIRKKPKAEPIDVDDYDAGNAPLETDDTEVKPGLAELAVDSDEAEPDVELQAALARARRLRTAAAAAQPLPKVEEVLQQVKEEAPAEGGMLLDATAEFCRTLGDAPAPRQPAQELEDEDMELEAEGGGAGAGAAGAGAGAAGGAWSRVEAAAAAAGGAGAARGGGGGALGAEPALGAGVAGALRLALSKGYLERPGAAPPPRSAHHHLLAARHYSIDDKAHGEDDKYGRRERGHGHGGPLQEFREKASFRPNVKLEYADDDGRPLCPKEAFRYLSHKFHGKGPGKNKQEKRIKKALQEGLMKKMSSTDTPLNTLQMLQDKQRETHSPYIVLSGAKRDNNN